MPNYAYTYIDIQYIHILPDRIPVGWVLLSKLVLHRVVGRVSFATSLKTFPNTRVGRQHTVEMEIGWANNTQ